MLVIGRCAQSCPAKIETSHAATGLAHLVYRSTRGPAAALVSSFAR